MVYGAQAKIPSPIPSINNLETTSIYLITVGLGKQLHARYGHTFLKVASQEHPHTFIYNWGMFSFDDPWFPIKFYLGERIYWVESTNEQWIIQLYQRREDRNVWQQLIHLTNAQKGLLISGINKAIREENMFFRYEHFHANCATIPRDLLNNALGGYIYKKLSKQTSKLDYRYYVREHMSIIPALGFLLDVVMNSKLDTTLSLWQESFYPVKLSEYLSSLSAIDDNQQEILQKSLLGPKQTMVVGSSEHLSSSGYFALYQLCITLLLSTLCAWLVIRKKSMKPVFVKIYYLFWSSLSATFGSIMLISWIFSTHYDMHHNLNLWLFCCLDILFIYVLFKKHPSQKLIHITRIYTWIRCCTSAIYIFTTLFGLSNQNVSSSFYYLMPQHLMFLGVWLWHLYRHTNFAFKDTRNLKHI